MSVCSPVAAQAAMWRGIPWSDEYLRGSDFADVLVGNATDNRLHGGQGDDSLSAAAATIASKGTQARTASTAASNGHCGYAGSFSAVTVNLQGRASARPGDAFG